MALAGVGLWQLVASYDAPANAGSRAIARAVAEAEPAGPPFPQLTETQVSVGGDRLRVVVTDDVDERSQGLRRRRDLGRYDGMLFAYPEDTTTSFTMSTVPVPLDIGFYDDRGRLVTRLRMAPCPGSEAECPSYRSEAPFRYALETLAGDLPRGRLAA